LRALQTIQADFTKSTRYKGEDYFRRRTVTILDHDATRIRASVRGTYEYEVQIGWDGSEYSYDCTCPHFQDHGELCKHVWATILTADARHILPSSNNNVDETKDAEDDGDNDEDNFVREVRQVKLGNRKVDFVRFREQPREPEPKRHAVWRRRLSELRNDYRFQGNTPPQPWPVDKQIIYAILADENELRDGLSINLYSRWRGKTELKRLRLQTDQVAALPDPLDRQLIAMLFGLANDDDFDYEADRAVPNELTLRDVRDAAMILQLISQSGRCALVTNGDTERFDPLEWDQAGPWRFHLTIAPDETGDAYRLQGLLKRGEDRLELS
jgi:SWIM zinc finger